MQHQREHYSLNNTPFYILNTIYILKLLYIHWEYYSPNCICGNKD